MHVPKSNHLVPMPMSREIKMHTLQNSNISYVVKGHSVERGKPTNEKYFLGSKLEEQATWKKHSSTQHCSHKGLIRLSMSKSLANSIVPYMDHAFIAFLF